MLPYFFSQFKKKAEERIKTTTTTKQKKKKKKKKKKIKPIIYWQTSIKEIEASPSRKNQFDIKLKPSHSGRFFVFFLFVFKRLS